MQNVTTVCRSNDLYRSKEWWLILDNRLWMNIESELEIRECSEKTFGKTSYVIPLNLQFFAQEGPGGEKTEEPTSKKLDDARKEGQVAKSQELAIAASLIGLFVALKAFIGIMGNEFIKSFHSTYGNMDVLLKDDFTKATWSALLRNDLFTIIKISLPVFIVGIFVAIISNALQFKWMITTKPLKPKFDNFNPIKGFKKIFSKDKLFELVKSIIKIGIIFYMVYSTLSSDWSIIYGLYDLTLNQAILLVGDIVIGLGLKISFVYLVIGIIDFMYQKRKFKKDMMMTKQEIKDEYKQTEGDPQIKGRIKQKMREVSQKRMMQQLPEADVVITNPTHYAAAIKYDKDVADAPILLAKGADLLAQKIKDVAKENHIEIVENKPLARMLYFNVEIGDQIPPELYQMTAEVLAYVYGLKDKKVDER